MSSKQSKKRDDLLKKSYKTSLIPSEILNIMNIGKDNKSGRQLKSKYVKNYVQLEDESNPLEKSETMTSQKATREQENGVNKEDTIQNLPVHKAIRKRKQKMNKSVIKNAYQPQFVF